MPKWVRQKGQWHWNINSIRFCLRGIKNVWITWGTEMTYINIYIYIYIYAYIYVYIKVKWSCYRPGVAQRVGTSMTVALEGGEWSTARPSRSLPLGKTRYPLYRKLGGPQGRSWRAENLVPTGNRSRTVQPVLSRYTDWATRPRYIYIYVYIYIYIYNPFIEKNCKWWTQIIACLPLPPDEARYKVQGHYFIRQLSSHCCRLSQIAKLRRDFGEMWRFRGSKGKQSAWL